MYAIHYDRKWDDRHLDMDAETEEAIPPALDQFSKEKLKLNLAMPILDIPQTSIDVESSGQKSPSKVMRRLSSRTSLATKL